MEGGHRLVKSGLECVDCDASMQASVHALLCGCALFVLWAVRSICSSAKANGAGSESRNEPTRTRSAHLRFLYNWHFSTRNMEAFREKAQTKYKVMVTFA
jgi:hypothetical protein